MKSFKEYIQEGIVEVDNRMLDILTNFTMYTVFDNVKVSDKPQVQKIKNDYLVKLTNSKNKFPYEIEEYDNNEIKIKLVSDKYKIGPDYDNNIDLMFNISFNYDSNTLGGFDEDLDMLMVNLKANKFKALVSRALENLDNIRERDIKKLENELSGTIEHELIHAIRDNLHKILNIEIPKMKSGYDSDIEDYLTSDTEIESWAINVIRIFKSEVEDISYDIKIPKEDLKSLVRFWLTNEGSPTFRKYRMYYDQSSLFNIKKFLLVMKQKEPKRYRNVISKIYQELKSFIDDLYEKTKRKGRPKI